MTISVLPLLTSPGKVASLSHSLMPKTETLLAEDSLTPSFGELLAPQQRAIKTVPLTHPEPKGETTDNKDLSEPPQATTLLNLVTLMLPAEPPSLGSTPSATLARAEPEAQQPTVSLMNTAPHSAPSLTAKKSVLNDTLSQGSAQQAIDSRQPSANTVSIPITSATAQLISSSAGTVQSPLRDSRVPQAPTAPHSLTQPPAFPELALHAASAQEVKAPLGSIQWQRDLSQQIIFHKQGQHTIHLKLHPEELGDVKISMTVNKDHAELIMLSNHGQVRSALEAALPQLRQALADNGIQLGNSQVGHDSASGQQSTSSSNQPPAHPRVTLTQGDGNELSPTGDNSPALLRDGSQISLLV
ncbi:flagellar hook-length control protein FliK [Rosenbergiella nectarea]|uniref:flagellar hook-length control protein FliK n=1 Tax=Rosenbergiella nectarea TaxID=988801 RepID=UPI001F4DB9D5|nr:flagellar hook-length control protein FliK [Rosenbergiella nectarea]